MREYYKSFLEESWAKTITTDANNTEVVVVTVTIATASATTTSAREPAATDLSGSIL
jgi:hypothetical protein